MEIKIFNNPLMMKRDWEKICINGEYSSFYFWELVWLRSPIYLLPYKSKLTFFEVLDNNKPILIVPLCKKIGKNEYFSMSMFNGTFKFDFVFDKTLPQSKLNDAVNFLFDNIIIDSIVLEKIIENEKTYNALLSVNKIDFEIEGKNAISINDLEEYEQWNKNLTKNARQNIRTAYNRLNTDDVKIEFTFIENCRIPNRVLLKMIDLYCDRHISRYGLKVSAFKRFYLKHLDFSTIFLQKSASNFYCILRFNGELAAFMSGINEGGALRVPRLSIQEKFSRYSPGIVLVNETIKKICLSEKIINSLDLGIGDENYKKVMGGTEYNMCSMIHRKA